MDMGHTYAVLLAGLFAIAAGLVGSVALMKRMVLASDVISHLALPGLGIAFLFKINPLVGGGATLFWGRSSFGNCKRRRDWRQTLRSASYSPHVSESARSSPRKMIYWMPSLAISRPCHWSVSFLGWQPSFWLSASWLA